MINGVNQTNNLAQQMNDMVSVLKSAITEEQEMTDKVTQLNIKTNLQKNTDEIKAGALDLLV